MSLTTAEETLARARDALLKAMAESIAEIPQGLPSGMLYAAVMTVMNLDTYQGLIGILRDEGLITSDNHLLVITDKGRNWLQQS